LLLTGGGDGIMVVAFVTISFLICTARWHPEMQFVICAIVVIQDIWVSASNLSLLKSHFGGQIVKENRIVNTHSFHADHIGSR
jgi:uncharacterized membrane protein YkgB